MSKTLSVASLLTKANGKLHRFIRCGSCLTSILQLYFYRTLPRYGTSEGAYSDSFTLSADFDTSITITGLQAGTYYYLAITARDTDGLESGYLPIAKKQAR
jgi:hypothetical protein